MNNFKKYSIGVDIGGTNTDAVLVCGNKKIVASVKVPTQKCIEAGLKEALQKLIVSSGADITSIDGIYVGTTHATNAILQCEGLYRVGVIRLAGHQPALIPPCYNWPQSLRNVVYSGIETIDGGFECNGRPITAFNKSQACAAVEQLLLKGAESLAVIGAFSPLKADQENMMREIVMEVAGADFPISLSHQIGGIGIIERENSTILNAALQKVMTTGFQQMIAVCKDLKLSCPLYVTQNNGSLIDLKQAMDYPVLTISAGPTNSFVGATKLAGLSDAVVVDIGGTSTDVGIVQNGFPRRCLHNSNIGGVKLNFSMPDVLSVALGGGSHVRMDNNVAKIGPLSCAHRLLQDSIAFGGTQLTMTDAAICLGHVNISGAQSQRISFKKEDAHTVMKSAGAHINNLISRMSVGKEKVVLVGGGASLIPLEYLSNNYQIPEHASVANAYGAALAEISATIDTVVSLANRDAALDDVKNKAVQSAIAKGAHPASVRLVDLQIIPYHYMPGLMARVIATAAGKRKDEI